MQYGISYNESDHYNNYIRAFDDPEKAERWLNREEGDFRIRCLYDDMTELLEINDFVLQEYTDNGKTYTEWFEEDPAGCVAEFEQQAEASTDYYDDQEEDEERRQSDD